MPELEYDPDLRSSIADINASQLTSIPNNASDPFLPAPGAKYKLMSPAKLPISRSITLTVPPGLSPSSFLESPVLLSNITAEPSPTTGSLFKPQIVHGRVGSATLSSITGCHDTSHSEERRFGCFEFRPPTTVNPGSGLPALVSTDRIQQQSERFSNFLGQRQLQPYTTVESKGDDCLRDLNLREPVHMIAKSDNVPAEDEHIHNESDHREQSPAIQASNPDHRGSGSSLVAEKASDDGYNWRKYGQKHVKGSEFPRSYYKCTHPNCEVKKLFERSHDGHITEIIYKGQHDHPKPQSNRRFSTGAFACVQEEGFDKYSSNYRDDKYTSAYGQLCNNIDQIGTLELSPVQVSQSNRTHDEGDDDDEFSKRRKMDIDVTPVVKPIREPRVVVQTLSEVDILDDGYRWRKYGQKVVRGNPNPRSYYKCTNAGCPVRKHVERASHDPKAVITTYEGKHNHDVPTAKTSSHDMAGPMAMSGMPRNKPDEVGHISLDLGVGISSAGENRFSGQQQREVGSSTEGLQAASVSTYYGAMNPSAGQYESTQNGNGNHSFETAPLNHSSNLYPYSIGRIAMGP